MNLNDKDYRERLEHIELTIKKTQDKKKLKEFVNSVKVMNLKVEDKDRFLDDLNYKITGRRFTDKDILKDIEESKAELKGEEI